MSEQKEKLFTEVELELMNIIWQLNQASVKDVISKLPEDRKLAYTSVSTILRILEQKNILTSIKQGRGHIYCPNIEKAEYEQKTLNHVAQNLFDGAPLSMAKALLKSKDLQPCDILELREFLNGIDL